LACESSHRDFLGLVAHKVSFEFYSEIDGAPMCRLASPRATATGWLSGHPHEEGTDDH